MELKENFHHGKYYILNRKELLSFFLKQKRIVNILCKSCKEKNCYICNRFAYIKEELLKNGFFEKIPGDEQLFCGKFLITLKHQKFQIKTFLNLEFL